MKRLFTLILIAVYGMLCISAQIVEISSIRHDATDESAILRPVLDVNNDTCALVKVIITVPEIDFDGNVVEKHKTSSAYWVYVIDGTRNFNMYHRFLIPIQISSQQNGLTSFRGGNTYSVELTMSDELQKLLRGKRSDLKMSKKRFRMLELERNYYQGDSLYREAMSGRKDKIDLLQQASRLGWPMATIKLLKLNNVVLPERDSLVIAQYHDFDKYIDWLYKETEQFDKQLTKQHCEYRINFPNRPSDAELAIRRLEDKISQNKRALRYYYKHKGGFSYNSSSPIEDMLKMENCIILKDNPFDLGNRELQYLFLQMKRTWRDIIEIASTLPCATFRGINIE